MGVMGLSQGQPFVCRVRCPDFIALEAKHPRKRIRYTDVVVDNQDARRGPGLSRGHDLLWDGVDLSSRRRSISCYIQPICDPTGGFVEPNPPAARSRAARARSGDSPTPSEIQEKV